MMVTSLSSNTQAILLLTAPLITARNGRCEELLTGTEYNRLAKHLLALQKQPADLLSKGSDELIRACEPISASERLQRLLGRGFQLSQAVERWFSRSVWIVSRADTEYPARIKSRLKSAAPGVLYGCGDKRILEEGGLAIVGSRNASEAILDATKAIAQLSAQKGRNIISGGAKGVDQAAMRGAIEHGGRVCGVLTDSLEKTSLSRVNRDLILADQLTLLSPYDPNAGFNIGHAMQRNKMIYALADAAVIMEADYNKGGTWQGAVEQLEKLHLVPVYVRASFEPGKGLTALQEMGALPWPDPLDDQRFDAVFKRGENTDRVQRDNQETGSRISPVVSSESATRKLKNIVDEVPTGGTPNCNLHTLSSGSADLLFNSVRTTVRQILSTPKREAQIVEELSVLEAQARVWLRRLADESVIKKEPKTGTFISIERVPASGQPCQSSSIKVDQDSRPSDLLLASAKQVICRILTTPKKHNEIAKELALSRAQTSDWLRRLVEEGLLESKKSSHFVLRQRRLLEFTTES